MGLYEERINRVKAAIHFESVDRIPYLSGGPAFMAAYKGVKLKDYVTDMELNCTTNLEFCQEFCVDGTQAPLFSPAGQLPALWLSEVTLPGTGNVGENELWQIEESERMSFDEYDRILEVGFDTWSQEFLTREFQDRYTQAGIDFVSYLPTAAKRFREGEVPSFVDNIFLSPFEQFCGARSLTTFLVDDLMEEPEKMQEVFDVCHKERMENYRKLCENPLTKPLGVWIGGWRGTPSMLSPEFFQNFSWKYIKDYIDLCIQYDVIPVLHLDSNWDLGMESIRNDIAPHKIIVSLDGKTNIFKAHEILDGHSCIMGDVPAELLAFGKADDVYDYCVKLIREVGPKGYILCSGCDVPFNAKFENVRQMPKVIDDYASGKIC